MAGSHVLTIVGLLGTLCGFSDLSVAFFAVAILEGQFRSADVLPESLDNDYLREPGSYV